MQNLIEYPWLSDPVDRLSKSEHVTRQTFIEAVAELYNPAQLDVFSRAGRLAQARLQTDRTTGDHTTQVLITARPDPAERLTLRGVARKM